MKEVTIKVFEPIDVILRALSIDGRAGGECAGGTWCPRCRLALATTQLTEECDLPFDWADDMLATLTYGLSAAKTKEEADVMLGELLEKYGGL